MMTLAEIEIYESLDIYNWYKKLISEFNYKDDSLQKINRKYVEAIFVEFDYCFSYSSESKIYEIPTRYNGIDFYCNPQFKYGSVDIHLWAEKKKDKIQIGSTLMVICKRIEISRGEEDTYNYLGRPRYRNYDDIREIMRIVFSKFEEYKIAVVNSKIFEKIV